MADSAAPPSSLPDERHLWQFLEGVKGWRFTGAGYMVCGPGDGGNPMESAQVCRLATAVAVDEFGVALGCCGSLLVFIQNVCRGSPM